MGRKIVFTGGFSSGKTTMINILRDLGYFVIAESSETLINDYKNNHGRYPWENQDGLLEFHKEVFYKQLENEQKDINELTFCDRSIVDRLAFLKFDNLQVPEELLKLAESSSYSMVLFFEGDESIYKTDSHRPHGSSDSKIAEKIIKETYANLGYNLDIIPFCSREERLKIILKKVCQ